MREEIAFMCLSEKCELERLENNDIKLSIKHNVFDDIVVCNNTEFYFFDIEKIIYHQEDDMYDLLIPQEDGIEHISISGKDKFLRIRDGGKTGLIIEVLNINKFDSYPQYRTEIKDNKITTYFIPAIYSEEYILLESIYSLEAIIIHENIKKYMSDIITIFFNNLGETKSYLYHSDMIYEIHHLRANIAEVSKIDIYDNGTPSDHMYITYNELMNKGSIIFTGKDMFVFHDTIIKDGVVIGSINKSTRSDLGEVLYSPCDENYNDSELLVLNGYINSLTETSQLINELGADELIDQLYIVMNKITELNDKIKQNTLLEQYECSRIIYTNLGDIIVYDYNIIINGINQLQYTLENRDKE